jgi:hypothetical protein
MLTFEVELLKGVPNSRNEVFIQMLTQVEITKTDGNHYHVFGDKPVHIEEDADWPKTAKDARDIPT